MPVKAIVAHKCVVCDRWRAARHLESVQISDDWQTFYVCESCIDDHDGPGKFENVWESELPLALTLYTLSLDSSEDEILTDEYQGYYGRFANHLLSIDDRGAVDVQTYATPKAAEDELRSLEDFGFGASEDDAWISYTPRGIEVSFSGKYVGRYETLRRAPAAVSVQMRRGGYYPNVWLAGEHGPTTRRVDVW